MTEAAELLMGSWVAAPGLLELLERDNPDFDTADLEALPAGPTRGMAAFLGPERWRRLIERLRGLHREMVLVDGAAAWLDLLELHAPPAGRAELRSTRSEQRSASPKLKLFGIGYGSGLTVSLAEGMTFDTSQVGKVLQVRMLVTVTRYVDRGGGSLVRVDVHDPPGGVEHRLLDRVPEPAPALDPARWKVIRRADLSTVAQAGSYSWTYTVGRRATWSLGVDLPGLAGLGVEAGVQAEVEQSDKIETTFELPYGQDVIFYCPVGELPLAPRCAPTPTDYPD